MMAAQQYEVTAHPRAVKQFFSGAIFVAVLIGGWLYPVLGYFIPLCMLLGMGFAFFRGRKWCDWYCPRGSFYDAWVKGMSPQREIPRLLKRFSFRLGALLVLMTTMTVNLVIRWPNPFAMGKVFVVMLTATTVAGIILALVLHPRSWCTFCPIGTVSHGIGAKRYPLYINSDLCIDCKACGKVCPMQIKPYAFKAKGRVTVDDGDCIKCNLCVAVCPKRALAR
jgi:polyferredoxin